MSINYRKLAVFLISVSILGLFASPVSARTTTSGSDLVCSVLANVGMACGRTNTSANSTSANGSTLSSDVASDSNSSANNTSSTPSNWSWLGSANLSASLFTGKITKKFSSNQISLVKSPTNPDVYEIVDGKKHLIPNEEIFNDYGYKKEMVRTIMQEQLDLYPRARLVKARGDKRIFFITDTGLRRLIPNEKIYTSYGGKKEDIVEISKKEINYYPENKYVYLEYPLNRDVFMISSTTKQYLTPMAIRRMDLKESQVAPINQYELSYYKTGAPLIY